MQAAGEMALRSSNGLFRHRRAHPTDFKGPQRVTREQDGNTYTSLVFLRKEKVTSKRPPWTLKGTYP